MSPPAPSPDSELVDLHLDDTWAHGAAILHGGFLLETLTTLALRGSAHPDPLAVTAHFLCSPRLGPAQARVTRLRTGRSVSAVRVALVQGDRTCLDVVVTAGVLAEPAEPTYLDGAPPPLPPVETCLRNTTPPGQPRNGITEQLEIRLDPAAAGWLAEPTGRAEVRGWVRSATGREPDPLQLLCVADALPPVTFALGMYGWAPTLELTVAVRARPAAGWLRVVQRAQLVADGRFDERCEIWDSAGRLVAQASQLAMYRAGP